MNIIVGCSFTISKKLESLIEEGTSISININSVNGNKGTGYISMSTKKMPKISDIGNTSLMIDVVSIDESAPDFSDAAPVSTIFNGGNIENETANSPVTRFAKVNPDTEISQYVDKHDKPLIPSRPIVKSNPVEKKQKQPDIVTEPPKSNLISGYEALMEEIESLGNIDLEPVASRQGDKPVSRAEAVKIEKQGKLAPKIKKQAFVRNVRGGCIEIADLGEKILDREVFDLGMVSAKKLQNSRDLKWCLDNGLLEFCGREEYLEWLENRDSKTSYGHGLKTGSVDEIQNSVFEDADNPMVSSYSNGKGAKRESSDIINFDDEDSDEATKELIESMRKEPNQDRGRRQIPSSRSERSNNSASGAAIKSIRKV